MKRNFLKRGLAAALLLALFAACSMVRFAYDNADIALRIMAQEYFDLDNEDTQLLRVHIAHLLDWHRREELPAYAALLQGASDRLADGLTREEVEWTIAGLRLRYRALMAQAADEAAPVLAQLGPEHFAALERKLAENNARFAKQFLPDDEAKRRSARLKRLVGQFEDWTGSLSSEQEALIAAAVSATPGLLETQLDSRRQRQRELLALLGERKSAAELLPPLRAYLVEWERHRSPEYERAARQWEGVLVQLLLDLDRTLSPKQRARAVQRMLDYAEDFRVLARKGAASGDRATGSPATGA